MRNIKLNVSRSVEQICIDSFKSMFDERLEDGVNLTPKYVEMLVKEHCEPYMIVTQGFTHDLLANALDYMDWEYISCLLYTSPSPRD